METVPQNCIFAVFPDLTSVVFTGKPAYEMLESDPDWVPSLHMGHSDEKTRRTERLSSSQTTEEQRWETEARQADVFNAETQRESEAAEGGTEVFTGEN